MPEKTNSEFKTNNGIDISSHHQKQPKIFNSSELYGIADGFGYLICLHYYCAWGQILVKQSLKCISPKMRCPLQYHSPERVFPLSFCEFLSPVYKAIL